jgi:hypothetical protein
MRYQQLNRPFDQVLRPLAFWLACLPYLKIFNSVVVSLSVLVVYVLGCLKRASDVLGHHIPVLKNLLSVASNGSVSLFGQMPASKFTVCHALLSARLRAVFYALVSWCLELFAACRARSFLLNPLGLGRMLAGIRAKFSSGDVTRLCHEVVSAPLARHLNGRFPACRAAILGVERQRAKLVSAGRANLPAIRHSLGAFPVLVLGLAGSGTEAPALGMGSRDHE